MDSVITYRRYLHRIPELDNDLPKTTAFVQSKLEPLRCQISNPICGSVCAFFDAGKPETVAFRADMDALPETEETGLPFTSEHPGRMHACGHDGHTAMALTLAEYVSQHLEELPRNVLFLFQPAEETFQGSKNMIEHGILENPKVDAALAYHVSPGKMPVGLFMYNDKGTMMYSVDGFKITVKGKGSHGAYPHAGVDPINIGVHIHLALQELIARETDPAHACVLTIGQFKAGEAANIIPETAVLQGTIRTNNTKESELLVRRMKEVAEKTADAYNGSVEIEMISEVPPLICNPALTDEMIGYMKEMDIPGLTPVPDVSASASEDFAVIAEKVPSTFMYLSAGYTDERGTYPAHNPKVQFNEDVCPIGVACLAQCAVKWLESHQE